jgi:uncharacterized protein (DUF2336 family)
MTENSKSLERLTNLANEKSSTRRRELLREITDLFFQSDDPHTMAVDKHFDDILSSITREMDSEIRMEIARRFAHAKNAPTGLIRQLANDNITVAEPVLSHSTQLSDTDLTQIVAQSGQSQMRAISKRHTLSEAVTGVIAEQGDSQTLVALAQNQGAQFSRDTMALLVNKSESQTDLQSPLINHKALPPDLLNEMYFFVEDRLRKRIIERNAQTPPEVLERAMAQARATLCGAQQLPADYKEAEQFIKLKKLRKQLSPVTLAELARGKRTTRFYIAFAELTGLDFETARQIWMPGKTDAVAIVCKVSDIPRDLFATLVVLMSKEGTNDLSAVKTLCKIYEDIPKATAERTMRFWKMRKLASTAEAA